MMPPLRGRRLLRAGSTGAELVHERFEVLLPSADPLVRTAAQTRETHLEVKVFGQEFLGQALFDSIKAIEEPGDDAVLLFNGHWCFLRPPNPIGCWRA